MALNDFATRPPDTRSPYSTYPQAHVVDREISLLELSLLERDPQSPAQLVVLGLDAVGLPYRSKLDVAFAGPSSPLKVLTYAREYVGWMGTSRNIRVAILAFEDKQPGRHFVQVVVDGLRGHDVEKRVRTAAVEPPLYPIGRHVKRPDRRFGRWVEMLNPVPPLFIATE